MYEGNRQICSAGPVTEALTHEACVEIMKEIAQQHLRERLGLKPGFEHFRAMAALPCVEYSSAVIVAAYRIPRCIRGRNGLDG